MSRSTPEPSPEAQQGSPRELLRLADELLAQAGEIRRRWSELQELLDEALSEAPSPARGRGAPAAETPSGGPRHEPDPRRLVAVEMLVSGRSRDQVTSYLHDRFGADAAREVIEDIYGDADARR